MCASSVLEASKVVDMVVEEREEKAKGKCSSEETSVEEEEVVRSVREKDM